jgi:TolB-like protein/tRNA A-37 threonylcarbamoyl transferase component Bud32/Tfp pilus assembly protein PilF
VIGRSLSHYSVMDSIGAGGMGVVYRARDAHLERDVALKVLPADTLADDAARRRFRKEALALSTLNHPNIATVFDFDTQDGVDFLVMELVPGESLRDRLKSGPLAIEEAARLGRQLLEGLSAAHARGVVHRDLKPENVRVTPEGRLKVLDFGLATLVGPVDESATTRTVSELGLKGTVPYMAPEQLRGQAVDARTDLFAAGAVLYEMVTGSRPFAQKAGPALIEAILHAEPPAPRSLNPAIPEGLEAVLLKSLEKDPKGRYQSAAEFLRDLDEAAQGEMPVVPPRPWRRALWIAAAAVTATLGTLAGVGIHRVFFATAPIDSLAVLPFENQDANPDAEYLSDGIAESIINNVSQIRGVRVIARTSAFRYKGRHVEPKRAARELSVRAVLTGYVQRRGDDLVVSAELVDTENDRHLWGQRYTSRFSEILAVEENIAARISDELRLRLTAEEGERLAKRRTVRPEAYDLYLKGRHDVATGTPESLRQAVRFFEESLKVDPDFALAHAGMAEALYFSSGLIMSPRDAMPRVRDEARNALRLDTDLAEAHAILAMVDAFYDRDWESGEAGLRRALALNPGYSPAHIWYGLLLTAQGRAREALEEMKRATEIDPLSSTSTWYAIFPYLWAPREERQLDQAAAAARAILSRDPDFYFAYNTLAVVNQLRGLHDEAIRNLEAAVASVGETTDFELLYLGHAYAIAGRKDEARRIWTQVSSLTTDVYRSAFARAILQFGLGDRDSGFAWLERAYEDRQEDLALLNVDPRFDDLHDDPRFQSLRRRLRLEPGAHEPVAGAP